MSSAPPPDALGLPAMRLALPLPPLRPEASLRRAAQGLAHGPSPVLVVADDFMTRGVITETGVRAALEQGALMDDAVGPWVDRDPLLVPAAATGAEALRRLSDAGADWALLADSDGVPLGVITTARLIAGAESPTEGRRIGGMATPFGVYLTDGRVSGGAGGWALVAAGAALFSMFLLAAVAETVLRQTLLAAWAGADWYPAAAQAGVAALFLLILRLSPIAGIHAAEHKVVHAVEQGEPLRLEIVRRMPREHPRCGTNLAVGAVIFLGIFDSSLPVESDLKLLLGAVMALSLWQPLGRLAQRYGTTRPPNDRQILSGIRAGEELLKRMGSPNRRRKPGQAILASGILHILAGSIAAQLLVLAAQELLGVPEAWRVIL